MLSFKRFVIKIAVKNSWMTLKHFPLTASWKRKHTSILVMSLLMIGVTNATAVGQTLGAFLFSHSQLLVSFPSALFKEIVRDVEQIWYDFLYPVFPNIGMCE